MNDATLQRCLQADAELAAAPDDQRQPRPLDGDPVDAVIGLALDRLDARRQRVRDPKTGQFVLNNGGRLETGERSEAFWLDLEPARREIEDRVRVQLGLTGDDAAETALGIAGAYAEARLIRRSEFLQLSRLEDIPANLKQRRKVNERRRRHLSAWSMAFDRELKAAMALGLERRTRRIGSFTEALNAAPIVSEKR